MAERFAILRRAREAAGLTQEAMARLLRCSQPQVHRIESGAANIRVAQLGEIAAAYGVKASDLVGL